MTRDFCAVFPLLHSHREYECLDHSAASLTPTSQVGTLALWYEELVKGDIQGKDWLP